MKCKLGHYSLVILLILGMFFHAVSGMKCYVCKWIYSPQDRMNSDGTDLNCTEQHDKAIDNHFLNTCPETVGGTPFPKCATVKIVNADEVNHKIMFERKCSKRHSDGCFHRKDKQTNQLKTICYCSKDACNGDTSHFPKSIPFSAETENSTASISIIRNNSLFTIFLIVPFIMAFTKLMTWGQL